METIKPMVVDDLRALLASVPGDAEIVAVEYHESIPIDRLDEGEYDEYGGSPTGRYIPVTRHSFRVMRRNGKTQLEIDHLF